ncbi:MAG: pseudouridine-5'-phosphate glycosidase, partial [Pseudomonadota bacterium]
MAREATGGTTVAATMMAAASAGIGTFATGG